MREEIFRKLLPLLKDPSPVKVSILYYNIRSLQVSRGYVFESGEDFDGLVQFLNCNEFEE